MYQRILEFIYPRTCPYCGQVIQKGICRSCQIKSERIREPRCKRCGKPIRYAEEECCTDCRTGHLFYEQGRSLYLHKKPVNKAVYEFKFHNKRIYGETFAAEMADEFGDLLKRWKVGEIIPVPLHPEKMRKRGYNQAGILADELGKRTGISVNKTCVYRITNTIPQKMLGQKERQKNLRRAFAIDREWRPGGNVLIIDDIYTTGSTINAIARLLKKMGAKKVYFLTITIGEGNS